MNILKLLDSVLEFQEKQIITRDQWGSSFNFVKIEPEIKNMFSITTSLKALPYDSLVSNQKTELSRSLNVVIKALTAIDKFDVNKDNPNDVRNKIIQQFITAQEDYWGVTTPLLGFLGYLSESSGENLKHLRTLDKEATTRVKNITEQEQEINEILGRVRSQAVESVAQLHSEFFEDQVTGWDEGANRWLCLSGAIFVSLGLGVWFLFSSPVSPELTTPELIRYFGFRFGILGLGAWALKFTTSLYNIARHNATNYKRDSVSVSTIRALKDSANDPSIQDAIVEAASKRIFGPQSTGYIQESPSPTIEFTTISKIFKQTVDDSS